MSYSSGRQRINTGWQRRKYLVLGKEIPSVRVLSSWKSQITSWCRIFTCQGKAAKLRWVELTHLLWDFDYITPSSAIPIPFFPVGTGVGFCLGFVPPRSPSHPISQCQALQGGFGGSSSAGDWRELSGQAWMRSVSSEIWWIWADLVGIGGFGLIWWGLVRDLMEVFAVYSWMFLLFPAAFYSTWDSWL